MIKIRIFDNTKEAGIYAASLAEQVILRNTSTVLGLATGSTSIPFYDALVRFCNEGLNCNGVTTFNLDEYVGLPSNHPQSYRHFMDVHLFSKVKISDMNIYFPDGTAADLKAECNRYDNVLKDYELDFQLLGIGTNGHIGFNEPSHLLLSNTHVVSLSKDTIQSNARFFQSELDVPRQAITMGVQAILQAKQIVLMAFGYDKAKVVAQAVQGQIRTDLPATMLQLHRDVTFVLDAKSSSEL